MSSLKDAHDPYPTYYRANSRHMLKRLSSSAGLFPVCLELVEPEPSYGKASPWLFFPMVANANREQLADFRTFSEAIFSVRCKSQLPKAELNNGELPLIRLQLAADFHMRQRAFSGEVSPESL